MAFEGEFPALRKGLVLFSPPWPVNVAILTVTTLPAFSVQNRYHLVMWLMAYVMSIVCENQI